MNKRLRKKHLKRRFDLAQTAMQEFNETFGQCLMLYNGKQLVVLGCDRIAISDHCIVDRDDLYHRLYCVGHSYTIEASARAYSSIE